MTTPTFESPGQWWLPDDPERRIPGVLRLEPDAGVRVALFETLADDPADFAGSQRYAVLHGTVHDSPVNAGAEVSLFDAFATSRSLRSNGSTAETIVANDAYVGDRHVPSKQEPYSHFVATLAGLGDWLSATAIERSATAEGRIQAATMTPKRTSVRVAAATLEFVTTAQVSYSRQELVFRDKRTVHVKPDAPQDMASTIRDFLIPLRNFLSLATGQMSRLETCSARLSEEATLSESVHDLRLWAAQQGLRPFESRPPFDLPIAPPSDAADLEGLLARWWTLTRQNRKLVDFVFGLLQEPPRFIEVRFATALLALDELAARFATGNASRLIHQLGTGVDEQLGSSDDFIQRVANVRKSLWTNDSSSGSEIAKLTAVIMMLFKFVFLNQIGADVERLTKSPEFRHHIRQLQAS